MDGVFCEMAADGNRSGDDQIMIFNSKTSIRLLEGVDHATMRNRVDGRESGERSDAHDQRSRRREIFRTTQAHSAQRQRQWSEG